MSTTDLNTRSLSLAWRVGLNAWVSHLRDDRAPIPVIDDESNLVMATDVIAAQLHAQPFDVAALLCASAQAGLDDDHADALAEPDWNAFRDNFQEAAAVRSRELSDDSNDTWLGPSAHAASLAHDNFTEGMSL